MGDGIYLTAGKFSMGLLPYVGEEAVILLPYLGLLPLNSAPMKGLRGSTVDYC